MLGFDCVYLNIRKVLRITAFPDLLGKTNCQYITHFIKLRHMLSVIGYGMDSEHGWVLFDVAVYDKLQLLPCSCKNISIIHKKVQPTTTYDYSHNIAQNGQFLSTNGYPPLFGNYIYCTGLVLRTKF